MNILCELSTRDRFLKLFNDLGVLTKNNTLNPKRKLADDIIIIDEFSSVFNRVAPIDLIVDIVLNKNCIIPNCDICGKELDLSNISNLRKKNYSHRECVKLNKTQKTNWTAAIEKRKETCLEKYGNESYFDYETMVLKARNTKKLKYGAENYVNAQKAKETKLKKYGCETYRNDEKIKETCLEKYGATNPFGSRDIKDKISNTFEEKYGGRGLSSTLISSKIKKTNLERYGEFNPMKSKEVSTKSAVSKKINYYGEELFDTLTSGIKDLYDKYYSDNTLSLNKMAKTLGIDSNTIARKFRENGFEILDRTYSCSSSYGEEFICNILKEICPDINIVRNTRKIISPKEIDIWLPDYNVGIEYHGSYWHTEDRVGDLHRQKSIMAEEAGIRLIQIFDYELIEKQEKIVSFLKNTLGYSKKIYARNCAIKEITEKESKEFLNENHLQGYKGATKSYALCDDFGNIIQVMTFGKPRFSKNYDWEIIRLATKNENVVIGGSQKLWKKFIVDVDPFSVITYADARFYNGSIYEKLGFKYIGHSGSDYIWFNGINKLSRYKTRKQTLVSQGFDENLTETQIMINNKYKKILGAGNRVFVYYRK